MDEATWRALSEIERQRLIAEAKLTQLKLRKELYGDDWMRKLEELEGDEEAIRRLKALQKAEFDRRLAELLKLRNRKSQTESDGPPSTPTNILEIEDKEVSDKAVDDFCVDWVKKEMDEAAWRALSETERMSSILFGIYYEIIL